MLTHGTLSARWSGPTNLLPSRIIAPCRCCRSRICSRGRDRLLRHERRRPRAVHPQPQPEDHLRSDPRPPDHHARAGSADRRAFLVGHRNPRSPGRASSALSTGCAGSRARLPYPVRRRLFAQVHRQFGGSLHLIVSAAASCRHRCSRPGGSRGSWSCRLRRDGVRRRIRPQPARHGLGHGGRTIPRCR